MNTAPADTVERRKSRRSKYALRGLRSMVFGVVIALMITGFSHGSLWTNLVQSVCIATMCWFGIDLGRVPLSKWKHRHDTDDSIEAQTSWPGWPLMMVSVVVGTFFGFNVGGAIASLILGEHMQGFFRGNWTQALTLLIVSLVPGTAITYWFYSRETIAAKEAAAQLAQRQAAEHQLKLLESQLEPHMLFNTLANLRVLIGMDPPRAQAMLDQLIAFLRSTLNASRTGSHSLSAEFARLTDYLALMQVRMGDRLQMHFDLPIDLAEAAVPPLLLQPLVENSIKHGLEPHVAGGRIDIAASREGGFLLLRVRDTGAGLSNQIGDGTSFGLVQVRERLKTLYGTQASLTLAKATDAEGGTIATIRMPLSIIEAPNP